MDKIHILEMINRYEGQSVHIYTKDGRFYTGQLNLITTGDCGLDLHRHLEIGWRQDKVETDDVLELHPV
jgi:hypothetical protein